MTLIYKHARARAYYKFTLNIKVTNTLGDNSNQVHINLAIYQYQGIIKPKSNFMYLRSSQAANFTNYLFLVKISQFIYFRVQRTLMIEIATYQYFLV